MATKFQQLVLQFLLVSSGVLKLIVNAQAVAADRKQSPVAPPNERRTKNDNDVADHESGFPSANSFHELCQWETFEAECPSMDEVLLVTGAVYGRYRLGGRCIQNPYGRMSCGRDALDLVGSRCSGRRRCTFPVTMLHSRLFLQHSSSSSFPASSSSDTCPMELTAHLLVKYTCLKVAQCDQQLQQLQTHTKTPTSGCDHASKAFLQVTTEPQYLANSVKSSSDPLAQASDAASGGVTELVSVGLRQPGFLATPNQQQCGTSICPWKLQADQGQRINITLIHFSTTPVDGTKSASPALNQAQTSDRQVVSSLSGAMGTQGSVACHRFASVTEAASTNGGSAALPSYHDLTACGVDRRTSPVNDDVNSSDGAWLGALSRAGKTEKHVYLSDSNSLRLEVYPPHGLHVIIRYQAVGCRSLSLLPDSVNIAYGHLEDGRVEKWRAEVSCPNEAGVMLKWRLRCTGVEWTVEEPESQRNQHVSAATYTELFRTCSSQEATESDETDSAGIFDRTKVSSPPSYGILVVIGLGIALGVAVGFSLLLVVLRCIRHDNDAVLSSEVTEAGTHVQYWKTPVAVKYDAYESRMPQQGGAMIYEDTVRQTELFSEAPSPPGPNALQLDRGSTTVCCRPSHPDYFRAAPEHFDVVDFRINAPSLSSSSAPADRHLSTRDAMTSFSMAHHVHCDEHVYEPTAHESMMFVNLPAPGGGGRTINACSGH